MISNADVNLLESRKLNLEIELNKLLKSNAEEDKINELKSEILYIKKQISQILGPKEIETQEKIKRRRLGVDEKNIRNYHSFKSKYKQISKMEISTKNILRVIESYLSRESYQEDMVKVMSR